MSLGEKLRGFFGSQKVPTIAVHLLLKGRIGEAWYDYDRTLRVPLGLTLEEVIAMGDKRGIPLSKALENSPHLPHTMMLNGERCPIGEHRDRVMEDNDELYLLAPLAGG